MAAPTEAATLNALEIVQGLSPEALDRRITSEVGASIMGGFKALARARHGAGHDDEVARDVHLMVLAYLMRAEVEKTSR